MATNPPGKSVPVEISFKKMLGFYSDMTIEWPIAAYETVLDMTEKFSMRRRMRTGPLAAVTLPLSIMLCDGAKGGKLAMSEGKLGWVSILSGLGAAGTGWWLAGKAVFGVLSAGAMAGAPAIVTGVAAAVAAAPALLPLMAVGAVASSVAFATIGLHLGLVRGAANIFTGIARSRDYFNGYKNQNYGEVFSDDPPAQPAPPAPVLGDIEAEYGLKARKPAGPVFNGEAAVKLGEDITYKKIKLKVKTPVA